MADPKNPDTDRQEELLAQLTKLAGSVELLAKGAKPPPTPPPPEPPPPDPDVETRRRVAFAYLFLGEVLGRRGSPVFKAPRVSVTRGGDGLTFGDLGTGTAARIRGVKGSVDLLEGLRSSVPAETSIPDGEPIDSIVVLEGKDGVAVALGPCLDGLIIIE
jgi:hypothetical protein